MRTIRRAYLKRFGVYTRKGVPVKFQQGGVPSNTPILGELEPQPIDYVKWIIIAIGAVSIGLIIYKELSL